MEEEKMRLTPRRVARLGCHLWLIERRSAGREQAASVIIITAVKQPARQEIILNSILPSKEQSVTAAARCDRAD